MGEPFEIIADTREITHDDWLKLRRSGIGGSDAGAAMGMSPWGSPLSVWADKRGILPPAEETDAMEYGKRMEPVLRQWFRDEVQKGLILPMECTMEEYPFLLRSTRWPWAIANLDGIVRWNEALSKGFGVLELKTADRSQAKYWGKEEIPDGYYCQVQHYMAVTGASFAYVFALVGKRPVLRYVPAKPDFIEKLMETEKSLWSLIESGEMPAPSGTEADDDVLSILYGIGGADAIDAPELAEPMAEIVTAKDAIKTNEKAIAMAAQGIKARMQNAERAIAGEYAASWSRFPVDRIDVGRLRKERPDVADEFTNHTRGERFTVRAITRKEESNEN